MRLNRITNGRTPDVSIHKVSNGYIISVMVPAKPDKRFPGANLEMELADVDENDYRERETYVAKTPEEVLEITKKYLPK